MRSPLNSCSLLNQLGSPIPEMVFGSTKIELRYKNSDFMEYTALDALAQVDHSSEKVLKVSYAQEWSEQR